ncbi:MAG: hypothetical protein AAF532_02850 [Planctomycetota bacterium]
MIEHEIGFGGDGVRVDRDRRLISDVALAGLRSRNGYVYAADALQAAVPLYEGKPVFLDHGERVGRPRERSARDLAGHIRNARFVGGRLRGDVATLETEAGRTLLALADGDVDGVGMSHVVLADRDAGGETVTSIREVVSVDAVVFPATTSTFRERHRFRVGPTVENFDGVDGDYAAGGIEQIQADVDSMLASVFADRGLSEVRRIGLFPRHVLVRAEVEAGDGGVETPDADEGVDSDGGVGGNGGEPPVPTADRDVRHFLLSWRLERGESGQVFVRIDDSGDDAFAEVPADVVIAPGWADVLGGGPAASAGADGADEASGGEIAAERDRLAAELGVLKRRIGTERRVALLLERSGLPEAAVTEAFRVELLALPDDRSRRRAISDRSRVLERCGRSGPRSVRRDEAAGDAFDLSIVSAIKSR